MPRHHGNINGRRTARWAPAPAVALALLAGAGNASAHVTVQPGHAQKGGYTKIAFRVPNESATTSTVQLEVTLPAEYPVASVLTKPIAGWTARTTTAKLDKPIKVDTSDVTDIVRTVAWTAEPGVYIGPGQFTEFEVSMGPLPDNTDVLVMPATQTYADGSVVTWDAPPPADNAPEPEHPAPALYLVGKGGGTMNERPGHAIASASSRNTSSGDNTARLLGGGGLAIGALGFGMAANTARRTRRPAAGIEQIPRESSE